MKILIDINHPAHVHYAKNIIKKLIENRNEVLVVSRDRSPNFELLKAEGIPFIDRGEGSNSFFGKAIYLFRGIYRLFNVARKFDPDLFLCFMSPYAPQVSKLFRKPCIIMDDTEHAKLHDKFTYPFCNTIITPKCFYRDLGDKQIRIDSFLELNYLHPNHFKPDDKIFDFLGIEKDQQFVILRFVAWGGHHDFGHHGLTEDTKIAIIALLEKKFKVFISSEAKLPNHFEKYRIPVPAEKMHDVLAYASLFVGESGTMAGECAVLGTPSIYINSLPLMGYLIEAKNNGLLFHFDGDKGVIDKINDVLSTDDLKEQMKSNYKKHVLYKIDGTAFMVWFLENYPNSILKIKQDPDFQYKFSKL